MNKERTNAVRARRISIITAAAVFVVAAVVALCAFKIPSVKAEGAGTVTIHVYDPEQQYASLGGWIWVDGGSGTGYTLSATPKDGEQLKKTYTDNGNEVTNTARVIEATFTEREINQFKSGKKIGLLICAPKDGSGSFWDKYEKEGSDVFVDISQAFDSNNHADVYYIRKDSVGHTDVEGAKMALEKVTLARFTKKDASGATVAFEATNPITNQTVVILYDGNKEVDRTTAAPGATTFSGTAVFTKLTGSAFDFSADYLLKIEGINTGASVSKSAFIDDADFISTFESADTQNQNLGLSFENGKTVFRLWAPFASEVSIKLYDAGTGGEAIATEKMSKYVPAGASWGGVWIYETDDNIRGKYYTYVVSNPGALTETIDPYATACGANGERAMVLDLDDTDPDGWENDKHLYATNPLNADTPIIWELHVQDFSMSPDSGMVYKGKYLAFTEENTTVPGTNLKTGVNYLKDLGITYVHLNPVYDFATVDEGETSVADDTKDLFNWGYDPQNYNIPEGSYSTDPSRGNVRITEFKQMVMALHKAGIGVIMDVVYNHTFSTDGQALNDTVPNYYHRTNADGSDSNLSGCGNDTASERAMTRKYFVESILYWAQEYHIDGFRFDLMGIHDKITIDTIRAELDKLDGGNGKKLLMYGEPWTGEFPAANEPPYSYTKRIASTSSANPGGGKYTSNANNNLIKFIYFSGNVSSLNSRVAVFNDNGRDGLRGNNDPGSGWIQGDSGESKARVIKMLEGGAGTSGSGLYTGAGSRNVAYASVHDNYPLWDQLIGKKEGQETPLYYENPMPHLVKMCETVSSAYLMSSGMSLMLAGEEMGRTKYGNHNSFKSPSKVNMINWSRQADFADMVAHYKRVIAVRKAYSSVFFSYDKSQNASFCYGSVDQAQSGGGLIVFTRTSGSNKLVCVFNATGATVNVNVGSGLKAYVFNGNVVNTATTSATVQVQANCTAIFGTLSV